MYAITSTSYRAIASVEEAVAGETVVAEIPQAVLDAIAVDEARGVRNQLLRDSDWTHVPDCPLGAVERTAWATYRQALRDLPGAAGFPDCQWPTPPATQQSLLGGN